MNLLQMNETVTITPTDGFDSDGDPVADGEPFDLKALVAPGNATSQFGTGGDSESVDFTVFLPRYTELPKYFRILVRSVYCVGRKQVWEAGGIVGGVVVLASSTTGRT